jgi:ribonuclease D
MGYRKRSKEWKRTASLGNAADSHDSSAAAFTSILRAAGSKSPSVSRSIWTWRERQEVLSFLQDYRKGCEQICRGEALDEYDERMVGDALLPALTEQVFRNPYLLLPSSLSSKQRRKIHECATELSLYHSSMGPTRDERTIVVTVYADGLDSLAAQIDVQVPYPMPIYLYKPWYCRKERRNCTIEQEQRRRIDHLIDQPGECFRDHLLLDSLDFEHWDTQDLSVYKLPPEPEPDETWTLVDTPNKMRLCIADLTAAKPTEIAFDLESFNKNKYSQLTCLLQLASDTGRDYVIDTLAPGVWDEVGGLAPLFADPSIVKVGHAIGGLDVRSLHRDFGIFVNNAFDTCKLSFQAPLLAAPAPIILAQLLPTLSCYADEATKVMKMDKKGLAAVCEYYNMPDSEVYISLKAQYQNCDWRRRPLTPPMIQYGRYDVHFLLRLRWLMMRDLTRGELWDDVAVESRNPIARVETLRLQPDLMRVISHSQRRCRDLWMEKKEPFLNHPMLVHFMQQARRKELDWTASHASLFEALVEWRNQTAKELECLPGFVAPLDVLIPAALQRPTSETTLRRISSSLPEVLEDQPQRMQALLDLVRHSVKADGQDPSCEWILRLSDQRKRKRPFPWAAAAAAAMVGAAGVAVAVMASSRQRR